MGAADFDKRKDRVRRSGVNKGGKNYFILCSKSGFSRELVRVALEEGVLLWDVKALESFFNEAKE